MSTQDPQDRLPLTHLTYHVLLALADADRHGYAIIKEVEARTDGRMELETGTLYAALKRLKDDGFIESVPASARPPGEDRRRRTYRLTPLGRRVLRAESERLAKVLAVAQEKHVLAAGRG
jgi:DNA-binding PadR family transcriptional regulator